MRRVARRQGFTVIELVLAKSGTRAHARSAIELGMVQMNLDTTWKSSLGSGTRADEQAIGNRGWHAERTNKPTTCAVGHKCTARDSNPGPAG